MAFQPKAVSKRQSLTGHQAIPKKNSAGFMTYSQLLKNIFSQPWELHFPVLNYALKGKSSPLMQSKIVAASVMFVDVKDFMAFAAKHPPAQVIEQLNQLFATITPIIEKHHGTVDKYMGDEVMAYFKCDVPWEYAQTALNAVHSAKAIQKAVAKLNGQWLKKHWPKLECGIGIHTGPVIYAPVGFKDQSAFTVIGDTVNLASRLQKMTRRFETSILVSERTQQLILHELPQARDLGQHTIKGHKQRLRVFGLPSP